MAQERKKRRIVLASILKPVDDTRMFWKMGISLAQAGLYEVIIVGYPPSSTPSFPAVQFISFDTFPRISYKRVLAKWNVFLKVWKLKPDILIFNTHELLLPAVLLKICFGTTIVYDVQENYYRNILHSGSFPWIVRWPLAFLVRFKEKLLAPSIDHFFLAEKAYETEFRFHRSGWTVIENKGLTPDPSPEERGAVLAFREGLHSSLSSGEGRGEALRLLFSGTLAESTGVFQAIQLAKELHLLDASITLNIIGHATLQRVQKKILNEIQGNEYICLIGGDRLVPHSDIMKAIHQADAGIISYPPSHYTKNSHPTKLFEYLSAQLPIILERHWPWTEHYLQYQPFIFFDFSKPDYPALLHELKTKQCYSRVPEDVTWASEQPKFLAIMVKI